MSDNTVVAASEARVSIEIKSALFGLTIGDALGVPVEFKNRSYLKSTPLTRMIGYGTHDQPPGTFSDDASLTFCLAEALTTGYDLQKIVDLFMAWMYEGYWTPWGIVFDKGIATAQAIGRLKLGIGPDLAGGMEELDNGNGSLMRILPLVFYLRDKPIQDRFLITKEISSLTHAHIRSVIACFYYLEFARLIGKGESKFEIYTRLQQEITLFLNTLSINPSEISHFDRLLKGNIAELPEDQIQSSGYVIHTLEASIWCLLTTDHYKDAVLKAVNLGEDTDTNGAVTGGLAGLLYGFDAIPSEWIDMLARRNDIEDLCNRLAVSLA